MKVVLLCGGKGTRIRDVSADVPKPMVEIAGLPIVHHIMNYYARFGLTDFVLCLGYKGDVIREYFSVLSAESGTPTISLGFDFDSMVDSNPTRWKVALVETGTETMTGGRIRQIQSHVGADTFALTYGDGVSNIDITRLLKHHRKCGKALKIGRAHV